MKLIKNGVEILPNIKILGLEKNDPHVSVLLPNLAYLQIEASIRRFTRYEMRNFPSFQTGFKRTYEQQVRRRIRHEEFMSLVSVALEGSREKFDKKNSPILAKAMELSAAGKIKMRPRRS